MNIQDHIDLPIQKAVVGMALLGFCPSMSCCGFNYKGEKVPKTHLINKPYIYIDKPLSDRLCYKLIGISLAAGWIISPASKGVIDFHCDCWSKTHPWRDEKCPHQPEANLFAIDSLEQAITNFSTDFLDVAIIVDGNHNYKNRFKYWQYEPVENWTVTKETFFNL